MRKLPVRIDMSGLYLSSEHALKRGRRREGINRETRLLLLAGVVACTTTSLLNSNAEAAIETCGEPPLMRNTEAATLLWEDCVDGSWNITVTGGGSKTLLSYDGTVTGDMPATLVSEQSLEPNDVLETPDPSSILFQFFVAGSGKDGLNFAFPGGATVCVDVAGPGGDLLVGPDRTPVTPPLDLNTMGPCGAAGDIPETCGQLAYDRANEQGTFLWQDCDSGEWHLRVTAGGSPAVDYVGSLTSDQPLAAISTFSFESNDTLDTSNPEQADYGMHVGNRGQDGLDFSLAGSASACLDAGGTVVVGPDRTAVQSPFDIQTLQACNDASPPPSPSPSPPGDGYAYLADADTTDSVVYRSGTDLDERPFPRIATGNLKSRGTAEQFSKYDVIGLKAASFDWLANVQAINPDVVGLRVHCPQEYQGYNEPNACRFGNGMPFDWTGPATTGCEVYAGHWLYAPGTRLRNAIGANTTTLPVDDASKFNSGRYIVIYDGGPGAFRNAEHAKVTAVNTWTDTLTLATRGFKSDTYSHSAGAIVAEHVIGNGANTPENWIYNLSTECPTDANGGQLNEIMAEWLAQHYDQDHTGQPTNARIDGILYDSDFTFIMEGWGDRKPDVDNDLVQDNGLTPNGENLWGDGLGVFRTRVRELLPEAVLVGGVNESRGYSSLNGNQLEGWPNRNAGSTSADYREIDGRLSLYSVQMHHGAYGPRYSEGINKMPTKLYPSQSDPIPADNSGFRFGFGLMLLDDGYYGQQNWHVVDPWWDEYAVDVVPGSPTFGQAIASNPQNESWIRQHKGWMGLPLGPRHRVYDTAIFAPERNLMPDGDFDSALGNWQGNNVSLQVDGTAGNHLEGTGALRVSKHLTYSESETGASAIGPLLQLTAGVQYTLAFAAKASEIRTIQVQVGSETEQFYIPTDWSRRVFTFTASYTGGYRLKLHVGRESTPVWIDAVYLFKGNADVFRRDFDNGVVVVNATPVARTVDLGGTFRRIKGTGQDPINNGYTVSQVTIAPHDAAILVRP